VSYEVVNRLYLASVEPVSQHYFNLFIK